MDIVIVVSLMVLSIIAIIETICLLKKPKEKFDKLAFAAVVPVFPEDSELRSKLDCLEEKLSIGKLYIEEIIIINYGATVSQLEICREFCYENSNAVITDPASLEKILSKVFAIEHKT